jgi:hypothetical protein
MQAVPILAGLGMLLHLLSRCKPTILSTAACAKSRNHAATWRVSDRIHAAQVSPLQLHDK